MQESANMYTSFEVFQNPGTQGLGKNNSNFHSA